MLAFFLSSYGAYQVGTTMIQIIENDFWSFLDDYSYGNEEKFFSFMSDA